MEDVAIKEFACPVISLTPMPAVDRPVPALLSPRIADSNGDKSESTATTVNFESCKFAGEENGNTLFDITFTVNTDLNTSALVVRRISVNNASLASQIGTTPVFFIEDAGKKKEDSAIAKRVRELSGIPHRGNFV